MKGYTPAHRLAEYLRRNPVAAAVTHKRPAVVPSKKAYDRKRKKEIANGSDG